MTIHPNVISGMIVHVYHMPCSSVFVGYTIISMNFLHNTFAVMMLVLVGLDDQPAQYQFQKLRRLITTMGMIAITTFSSGQIADFLRYLANWLDLEYLREFRARMLALTPAMSVMTRFFDNNNLVRLMLALVLAMLLLDYNSLVTLAFALMTVSPVTILLVGMNMAAINFPAAVPIIVILTKGRCRYPNQQSCDQRYNLFFHLNSPVGKYPEHLQACVDTRKKLLNAG